MRRRLVGRWNREGTDPIVRAEVVLWHEHTLDLGQTTPHAPERTTLLEAADVAAR